MQDETTMRQMSCTEFEALLTDALDGTLTPEAASRFEQHRAGCQLCEPLFAETKAGLSWLRSLEEAEPPLNLVRNILAQTSERAEARVTSEVAVKAGWRERVNRALGAALGPVWTTVRQPRFGMSFGMALFSVTLLLNIAGIRITELAKADLRPSAVVKNTQATYYETSNRVIKYVEDLRVVYELESRVRDLKKVTTPESEGDQPKEKQNEHKPAGKKDDNGVSDRERNQNQNYSHERSGILLAKLMGRSSKRQELIQAETRNCAGIDTRSMA